MASAHTVGRRAFLAATAGSIVAAGCRRRAYDPAQFARPSSAAVGIFPADGYTDALADVMWRGLQTMLAPAMDVRGRTVLLKPNIVEFERDTAINTHALVVAAAADSLLRLGARQVIVGEAPGHRRDVEYLLGVTGLFEHLRDRRLTFVDLNHDDVAWTPLRSRYTGFSEVALPATLLAADLVVSMPKLKTHHWAVLTCGMKNLFGVVPGAVYGWPKNVLHVAGIDNSIIDLTATVRPALTIVDGIVGMEGDGPIMGKPRPVGALIIGQDVVAVDATCARLMGVDPARVPYLQEAGGFLGHTQEQHIVMRGEPLARFAGRFELPPSVAGAAIG